MVKRWWWWWWMMMMWVDLVDRHIYVVGGRAAVGSCETSGRMARPMPSADQRPTLHQNLKVPNAQTPSLDLSPVPLDARQAQRPVRARLCTRSSASSVHSTL